MPRPIRSSPCANVYHAHTTGAAVPPGCRRRAPERRALPAHRAQSVCARHDQPRPAPEHGDGGARGRLEDAVHVPARRHGRAHGADAATCAPGCCGGPSSARSPTARRTSSPTCTPTRSPRRRVWAAYRRSRSSYPTASTPEPLRRARARCLAERRAAVPEEHVWRLGYAARVVPIKGLLDLIDALLLVDQVGFTALASRCHGAGRRGPGLCRSLPGPRARGGARGSHHLPWQRQPAGAVRLVRRSAASEPQRGAAHRRARGDDHRAPHDRHPRRRHAGARSRTC